MTPEEITEEFANLYWTTTDINYIELGADEIVVGALSNLEEIRKMLPTSYKGLNVRIVASNPIVAL